MFGIKQSFSYYLILLVLKLKGVKSAFSRPIIPYEMRKDDVKLPSGRFFKQNITAKFTIHDCKVTEISTRLQNKLLIYIHGGAFVRGPGQHHWDTLKYIAQNTADYTIWMIDYPKAPENDILTINSNIDAVYNQALRKFDAGNIVIMGDSAGGTLCLTLLQRIIKTNLDKPELAIVISPVIDASMSNEDIKSVDVVDPMLSVPGILSAKKMTAKSLDLKDPQISPLFGSVENFPKTIIFAAEHDICFPDEIIFSDKLKLANVPFELFIGEKMPHIWPLLPLMSEASLAKQKIINILKSHS